MTDAVELERIVRSSLRPQVEQLVERLLPEVVAEVVAESVNGAEVVIQRHERDAVTPDRVAQGPNKVCRGCGRSEPDVRFDPSRRVCRTCRGRQQRERAAPQQASDNDTEPHPPATPQTGRKGQRRREQDDAWAERRRQLIAAARPGATVETINGRQFRVLRLAPQCAPTLSP